MLVICAAFYSVQQVQEHSLKNLTQLNAPTLIQQQEQAQLIYLAYSQINQLNQQAYSHQLLAQHHDLTSTLLKLKRLTGEQAFSYLDSAELTEATLKVIDNNVSYQKLDVLQKRLTLTADMLESLISLQQARAERLYQPLKQADKDEQLTVEFATRYANLVNNIADERRVYMHLQGLQQQVLLVNLQASDLLFFNLTNHSRVFFDWFTRRQASLLKEKADLVEQVNYLKKEFINKNLIVTWQEDIKAYQAIQAKLSEQLSQLIILEKTLSQQANSQTDNSIRLHQLFPNDWSLLLTNLGFRPQYTVAKKHLISIAYGVVIVASVLFLFTLFAIGRKVKKLSTDNIRVLLDASEQLLTSDDVNDIAEQLAIKTAEQYQLIQWLQENIVQGNAQPDAGESTDSGLDDVTLNDAEQMLNNQPSAIFVSSYFDAMAKSLPLASYIHFSDLKMLCSTEQQALIAGAFQYAKVKPLRQIFSVADVKSFINHLRESRTNQNQLVSMPLTAENQIASRCLMVYQQGWHCLLLADIQQEIVELPEIDLQQQLLSQQEQVKEELTEQHLQQQASTAILMGQEACKQAVKAMLQSQVDSLIKKVPTSNLYSKMANLWWWGDNIINQAKLSAKQYKPQLQSFYLPEFLYLAACNIDGELQHYKNRCQLNDNLLSLHKVELDTALMQSLLRNLAQLMLLSQRNSLLTLTTKLLDKNKGQYVVQYQLTVNTDTLITNIPEALMALQQRKESKVALVAQVQSLLSQLFADDLDVALTESGYACSFTLKHAEVGNTSSLEPKVKFTRRTIAICGGDKYGKNLLADLYQDHDAKVIVFDDETSAQTALSEAQLKIQSIDLLVVLLTQDLALAECYQNLIENLPEKYQPKLLVCENGSVIIPSTQYLPSYLPLNKAALLNNSVALIKGQQEQKDNETGQAPIELEKRFVNSQIEVLFAASSVNEYAQLIRYLKLFGFAITFATSETDANKLWCSGRYLILISAFDSSPETQLITGKTVKRGVFALAEQAWLGAIENKHWQLQALSSDSSCQELIEVLQPWLVEEIKEPTLVPLVAKPTMDKSQFNHLAAYDLESLSHAFDFYAYVENQATPELAALMIDDYMIENQQLLEKIRYGIQVKSTELALTNLNQLTVNAKVLVAEELLTICQKISKLIEQQHFQQAQSLIVELEQQVELIHAYAEAI